MPSRYAIHTLTSFVAVVASLPMLGGEPRVLWNKTGVLAAPEANQAAAADEHFVYAIDNTQVAKYDRTTAKRLAVSTGPAKHLNSGFLWEGRLYCAHSNYPRTPELSEIKVLDVKTMELATFKDFGNYGGSLTWAIRHDGHWWCNFARYGADNGQTFLVKFDDAWKVKGRWTYPREVTRELGRYSISGGIWRDGAILVTGHDDAVLFRVRIPKDGAVLEYVDKQSAPFTGQGIAHDPKTGGLVGIQRGKRQVIFASAPTGSPRSRVSGAASSTGRSIDPRAAKPPVAKAQPHQMEIHGDVRTDPYFWLREKKNPAVIAYLEAENAYTAAVMKPTEPLQKKLYQEMLGRILETDVNVPHRERGYWYYTRTEAGKQYPIYCRKKETLEAPEVVMLDANELAKGEKFFHVRGLTVSDNGHLLAFAADTTGFREYYLSVKDLGSGKLLEDKLIKVSDFQWAADNRTLFYVTEDHAKRPHRLWRHTLGELTNKDLLLHEEKDELFWVGLNRSRDGKFLLHTCESYTATEQRFLAADAPTGEWKVILPRRDGHEYAAEHRDGRFYIHTNWNKATNFKVITCPIDKTDPADWMDLVPYQPAVMVTGVAVFRDHAVLSERENGLTQLRVIDLNTAKPHRIEFPEPVYDVSLGENREFQTSSIRFAYTSLVTPSSVYEYDLATRQRKLLKRQPVLGGYDPSRYESERIEATAADGTKVPISIVYKKGVKKDGTAPLLLYGYGSYGLNLPLGFNSNRVSLLDRGVIYAQAHIRGGSDLGREWYEQGKLLNKKNSFTDFIACADHLVKTKVCSRDRLVIEGRSAGGLLIGVTVNMRPDLCKAAVLHVPFVDAVNSMLDPDLPLTVQEYLQWGNPNKKADYDYLKSYCPYTNLTKRAYPSVLVTTSLNDSQVMYWEPAKWVAKLRTLKTDANPLLFKCNLDGGHGGASGRYDLLRDHAFVMSFILNCMGIMD
jgi:oligopeptidase B